MSEKQLVRGQNVWPIVRDMFGLGHLSRVRECVIRVAVDEVVQIDVSFYPECDGVPAPSTQRYCVLPVSHSTIVCEVSE